MLQIQVDTAVVNYDDPTGPTLTLVRYGPVSGPSIELQIGGPQVHRRVKEQRVTTRTIWDGGRLGFEHLVGGEARIRKVLKVVDGRLEVKRTVRLPGTTVTPITLRYDRVPRLGTAGGGGR